MIIEEDFSDIVSYAIAMSEPYSDRAHSFDFCYLYFRQPKEKILGNIEESCYALWSFLSSWGIVSGSTERIMQDRYTRLSHMSLLEYEREIYNTL